MLNKRLKIQVLAFAILAFAGATGAGAADNAGRPDPREKGMLYNANCAICHGQAKRGQPATMIRTAINKNTGGMGSLKFLSAEQIRAIATY